MSCFFRRDANIKPAPGTIIAEFASGVDAIAFQKMKGRGYVITGGLNQVFSVRVGGYTESVAMPAGADSALPAPNVPETGSGFKLIPLTQRGADKVGVVEALLARMRLPHEDGL